MFFKYADLLGHTLPEELSEPGPLGSVVQHAGHGEAPDDVHDHRYRSKLAHSLFESTFWLLSLK